MATKDTATSATPDGSSAETSNPAVEPNPTAITLTAEQLQATVDQAIRSALSTVGAPGAAPAPVTPGKDGVLQYLQETENVIINAAKGVVNWDAQGGLRAIANARRALDTV